MRLYTTVSSAQDINEDDLNVKTSYGDVALYTPDFYISLAPELASSLGHKLIGLAAVAEAQRQAKAEAERQADFGADRA